MSLSRRRLLGGCLSGCALALAGCTGDNAGNGDGNDGDDGPTGGDPNLQAGDRYLNSSFPMEVYDPGTDDRLTQIHWHGELSNSHWHQQPLAVPLGRWRAYEMRPLDQSGSTIRLGEDQPLQLAMTRSEETPADLLQHEISGNAIDIRGQNSGNGQYAFRLLDGDTVEWRSPLLLVNVR
jgi:hypothetical protein